MYIATYYMYVHNGLLITNLKMITSMDQALPQ